MQKLRASIREILKDYVTHGARLDFLKVNHGLSVRGSKVASVWSESILEMKNCNGAPPDWFADGKSWVHFDAFTRPFHLRLHHHFQDTQRTRRIFSLYTLLFCISFRLKNPIVLCREVFRPLNYVFFMFKFNGRKSFRHKGTLIFGTENSALWVVWPNKSNYFFFVFIQKKFALIDFLWFFFL